MSKEIERLNENLEVYSYEAELEYIDDKNKLAKCKVNKEGRPDKSRDSKHGEELLYNTKFRKRKGFTLIEMIVVVTIIGILSGIVAIKYNGAQKMAKENTDYANASVIATAAYMSKENGDGAETYKNAVQLKEKHYLNRVPKPQSVSKEEFTILEEDQDNGDILVKVGEKIFYPKPDKN
ncbi:MAG: type II secretion system protein [Peptostreptococcus sp.]|uniref:type II secretion system protein n=1 Tax=Peptostreptococcus sp. TaxID=1262 RepID=UPI002FCA78B0